MGSILSVCESLERYSCSWKTHLPNSHRRMYNAYGHKLALKHESHTLKIKNSTRTDQTKATLFFILPRTKKQKVFVLEKLIVRPEIYYGIDTVAFKYLSARYVSDTYYKRENLSKYANNKRNHFFQHSHPLKKIKRLCFRRLGGKSFDRRSNLG